jgi:hypothetical protein
MKEFQLLVCAKRSPGIAIDGLPCSKATLTSNKETPMKVTALTVLALHLATSAQAAEKPSQSFLKKAIQGNYAEVQMGGWRNQNGQSDNVKNFGAAGRPYSSKRESHGRSKVGGCDGAGQPECRAKG